PDWAKLLPDRHRKPAENAGAAVAPVQAPGKLQPLQPELFADHRRWRLLCHQRAEATAGTGAISCPISGTDDLPAWPTGQVQAGERLSPPNPSLVRDLVGSADPRLVVGCFFGAALLPVAGRHYGCEIAASFVQL